MTENESLKTTLQNAIDCATDDVTREDLEMMVKCLEELQQYRAVGTVEDVAFYKKCYDEESYEYCGEYGTDNCGCKDRMEHLEKKIAEFEAIGTIEEFKALKEKAEAKKPILSRSMMTKREFQICPICERLVLYDGIKFDYCQHCGQKLDWSE